MKKILKDLFLYVAIITLLFSGQDIVKANSYTYTVSFYSGKQGDFFNLNGLQVRKAQGNKKSVSFSNYGNKVVVSGLEYGDTVSCSAQDAVSLAADSKYYVKGIRLSGRDNNTVAYSAFTVTEDQDYVVAYGIPGEMTEYTVMYVDEAGNTLAPSRTYKGNVGDEPVIAYLYIEGYTPASYNQTNKLVSDSSANVFTFVYTQGQPVTPADTGNGTTTPAGGNGTTPGGAVVTPGGGAGADGGAGATDGAVVIQDGVNPAADGAETPEAEINDPNQNIDDQETPRASNPIENIADSITPLANNMTENGLWFPFAVGTVAVVGAIVSIVFIIKKRKNIFVKAEDNK